MSLIEDFQSRDLLSDCTDLDSLKKQLSSAPTTLYCGFDPTATSLHVGSLLPIISMRRFLTEGHSAIALLGTATAMIGDPSGKSDERNLLTKQQIDQNCQGIEKQIKKLLPGATVMYNHQWFSDLNMLDFLRDVGKHFSVNAMCAKDSVRERLNNREQGISYTEFSYMLLQSYDFYHLYKESNCKLQLGGSDQWGNITSGLDLIKRKVGSDAKSLWFDDSPTDIVRRCKVRKNRKGKYLARCREDFSF